MSKHTLKAATITMAHGAGGKAMRDLIDDVFVGTFYNEHLRSGAFRLSRAPTTRNEVSIHYRFLRRRSN